MFKSNRVSPITPTNKSGSRLGTNESLRKSRTLEDSPGQKSEVVLNKFKSQSMENVGSLQELHQVGSSNLLPKSSKSRQQLGEGELLLNENTPYNSEEDFLQAQRALLDMNSTRPAQF